MNKPAAPSKHAELAERIISRQVGASSPAVSPDGRHIAYVVTRVDHQQPRHLMPTARHEVSILPL
jgi:hypothetical protein